MTSLLTSLAKNPRASDQYDFLSSLGDSVPILSSTAGTITQNTVYLGLVRVAVARAVTTMHYGIGAANGNVTLGIYDSADGGTTLSRQATTAETATAGSNTIQSIALTATFVLQPNKDYWLAFGTDSATLTVFRNTGVIGVPVAAFHNRYVGKASGYSAGLPTSITGHAGQTTAVWFAAT